jgi:excisionase family DNA binding protein
MSEEKLLTVRDASLILGISEKEVVDLAEKGALPGYKIGGVYLRFKKEQIQEFQKRTRALTPKIKIEVNHKYSFSDKLSDFFYFNDFYILTILIIFLLLIIILRGY